MSKKPDMAVYHVADRGEGKKPFWMKIGAAWTHEDGQGFNLAIDFMPTQIGGRIVVRAPKDDIEAESGGE